MGTIGGFMNMHQIVIVIGFAVLATIMAAFDMYWMSLTILLVGYVAAIIAYRKKPMPSWLTWKVKLGILTAVWAGLFAHNLYVGNSWVMFLMWVPFYLLHASTILKQRNIAPHN
jgi:hypothetical protein